MHRFTKLLLSVVFISGAAVFPASAICISPSFYETPPNIYLPSKPSVPYCLGEYSYTQKHSCEPYEIEAYFDDVEEYIDELNNHHASLVDYANATADHANDYLNFAKCEAEEVSTQHE